jgi:hypothetical protein
MEKTVAEPTKKPMTIRAAIVAGWIAGAASVGVPVGVIESNRAESFADSITIADTTITSPVIETEAYKKIRAIDQNGKSYLLNMGKLPSKIADTVGENVTLTEIKDMKIDTVDIKPSRHHRYQTPYVVNNDDSVMITINYKDDKGNTVLVDIPYVAKEPIRAGCALSLVMGIYFDEGKKQ